MSEVKNTFSEVKKPENGQSAEYGFLKIKPETDMSFDEAKDWWKKLREAENEQPQEKSVKGSPIGGNGFDAPKEDGGMTEKEKTQDEVKGGAYKDLPSEWQKFERHHMPADSTNKEVSKEDGGCIVMDYNDHKKTASYGNTKEAQEYRAAQRELIEQGKFDEALQMDIDDIHEKFGDKYDEGIAELKEYYNGQKEEGKV